MKKAFFIILTILSISFHTSFASLSLEKPKAAPPWGSVTNFYIMRIGSEQGLYLLGEDHDLNYAVNENQINFQYLKMMLLKAEKEKQSGLYHVFVEHVADVWRTPSPDTTPANMMAGLLILAQNKDFKHVIIESCEVRKIIGAFQFFMQAYPTPELPYENLQWDEVTKRYQETFGFEVTKLRFSDIISEFDRLNRQMNEYSDQWEDPLIKEQFRQSLEKAEQYFAYLRGFLEGKNPCGTKIYIDSLGYSIPVVPPTTFNKDEPIFSFCCKDPGRRFFPLLKWIEHQMIMGFMNFVDLFLFHRILQLQREKEPVKKIIFVGGDGHANHVYWQLLRTNNGQKVQILTAREERFIADKFVKIHKPLEEIEQQEKRQNKSWCWFL